MKVLTVVAQALLNGLMTGTLIAIPAIGITVIFAVLRYPSFVIAAYTTIGAFVAWYANVHFGVGALPGLVLAAVFCGHSWCAGGREGTRPLEVVRSTHGRHRLNRAESHTGKRCSFRFRKRHARIRFAALRRYEVCRIAGRRPTSRESNSGGRGHDVRISVPSPHAARSCNARRRR
jgi:hypothetical protein